MATTLNQYTGDGSTKSFEVTFEQASFTSITVSLDGDVQSSGYTYDPVTKAIVFTVAPANGVKVVLRRLTDVDLLYKFGQGAAFTGANLDADFKQFQYAVEEVQNAADMTYVNDSLADEVAARQAADASLQAQISDAKPAIGALIPTVSWHPQVITNSVTIPDQMNAFSVGPQVAIAPGQAVTVGEGSTWTVLGNVYSMDELYNIHANNIALPDDSATVAVSDLIALPGRMSAEETKIQPIELGGTGNTTGLAATATALATARTVRTNLASTAAVSFDGTANVSPGVTGILPIANGGTGNSTGLAATATALATARTFQINLASTTAVSFNGTANVTPGVTGILPIANGGTGNSTGLAATATALATARTFTVNLASTTGVSFNGTADASPGVTGILPIANGGTGNSSGLAATATALATARTVQTDLASTTAASFDGTTNVTPGVTGILPVAHGGTGNATGQAATATALATARTFRVNLASTTAVGFDGTVNVTPGVTGVLPVANGGTGQSTVAAAQTALDIFPLTGTTAGGTAAAGKVGEILENTTTGTAVTSGATVNAASLTLSPGDWEITGTYQFVTSSAPVYSLSNGFSTVSATLPAWPALSSISYGTALTAANFSAPVINKRAQISASTTIYLTFSALFGTGTATVNGYIQARRMR